MRYDDIPSLLCISSRAGKWNKILSKITTRPQFLFLTKVRTYQQQTINETVWCCRKAPAYKSYTAHTKGHTVLVCENEMLKWPLRLNSWIISQYDFFYYLFCYCFAYPWALICSALLCVHMHTRHCVCVCVCTICIHLCSIRWECIGELLAIFHWNAQNKQLF